MTTRILSFRVAGQLCGMPALDVHDVIRGPQRITPVPRAAPAIIGILNLRGRIALAVCLRRYLALADAPRPAAGMSLVVEHQADLYCLAVDGVGEVLSLEGKAEPVPPVLGAHWRKSVTGVWQSGGELLAQLDVKGMIAMLCQPEDATTAAENK